MGTLGSWAGTLGSWALPGKLGDRMRFPESPGERLLVAKDSVRCSLSRRFGDFELTFGRLVELVRIDAPV